MNYNFDENLEKNLIKYSQYIASNYYYYTFGKEINWNDPQNLNEKINWLAFNTDTRLWSVLADKYAVREYIKSKELDFLLNDIYQKWDNIEDIDLTNLPQSFVIKTNCSCGDTLIIKDKSKYNIEEIKNHFKEVLKERFVIKTAEPHYLRIKPCIFAEKLLETNIVDYKVWCFNGNPYCIQTISDRQIKHNKKAMNVFDTEWNEHTEWLNKEYQNEDSIEKPLLLTEMLEYAKILSKGFPQVRVDFYITNNQIYFGEMTFTAACGRLLSFTNESLLKMGEEIKIRNIDNK